MALSVMQAAVLIHSQIHGNRLHQRELHGKHPEKAMCGHEIQHDQLTVSNQAEPLHLSLLYLQETIHQAVESVRSTRARRSLDMKPAEGTRSVSNSASSSQVSVPEAGNCTTDDGYSSGPSRPADRPTGSEQQRNRFNEPSTARGFLRVALEHPQYRDYASSSSIDADGSPETNPSHARRRSKGGVTSTFPLILHLMLESAVSQRFDDVICWLGHGRAWRVIDQERFIREVMPKYYRQTKFRSFQRQLCLYGFKRMTRKGPDYGSYYHGCFLRGRADLVNRIVRQRVKGWMVRQGSSPDTEPNFWAMPIVGMPELDPTPIAELRQRPSALLPGIEATRSQPPSRVRAAELKVGFPQDQDENYMAYPAVPHTGQVQPVTRPGDMPCPALDQPSDSAFGHPSLWMLLPISLDDPPEPDTFVEKEALARFLSDVDLESSCDGDSSDPISLTAPMG